MGFLRAIQSDKLIKEFLNPKPFKYGSQTIRCSQEERKKRTDLYVRARELGHVELTFGRFTGPTATITMTFPEFASGSDSRVEVLVIQTAGEFTHRDALTAAVKKAESIQASPARAVLSRED